MNRDELIVRIGALWLEADSTDEFVAAVSHWAAGLGGGLHMKQLLSELAAAHPEEYREAVSGTTLHTRRVSHAWDLGKFLADADEGVSQFQWALDHNVEPSVLHRWLKLYRNDPDFQALTNEKAEFWRIARARRQAKKTLS
jgi:hypothetical protein